MKRSFYSRAFSIGIPAILYMLMLHCNFSNPEAPTWDVNFVIPLINKTFTMQEMVEDNDEIKVAQDNSIYYQIDQDIDTVEIGAYLHLGNYQQESLIPIRDDAGNEWVLSDTIRMVEQIVVETGVFRQGQLNVEVENRSSKPVDVEIVIPAMTLAGEARPFEMSIPLNPNMTSGLVRRDLSGCRFEPEIIDGQNRIPYQLLLTFPEGAPSSLQQIYIRATITDLMLQRFRGGLNHIMMPLTSQKTELSFPEELDGIRIGRTVGTLSLFSQIHNVPVNVNIVLVASRKDGYADSISIAIEDLQSGEDDLSAWQEYPIEHIENLINLYPDFMNISGYMSIGDGYDPDHPLDIEYEDYIQGKVSIAAPLTFEIPPKLINETEVDTLDLDQDSRDAIRDNLNEAALVVISENHLPLGARVTLIFSKMRGDSTLYTQTHPTDIVKVLDMEAGETGGGSGTDENPNLVTATRTSTLDFRMTAQDLELFESQEVYWGMRLEFPGTQGMVKVSPDDYIAIRARMEASINTKIPEKDEPKGGGS